MKSSGGYKLFYAFRNNGIYNFRYIEVCYVSQATNKGDDEFAFYFILDEEPELEKRFGETYLGYKRNVPRWIPRTTPWEPRVATVPAATGQIKQGEQRGMCKLQ